MSARSVYPPSSYPPSRDVPSWVGGQMRLREFSDAGAWMLLPPYSIEDLESGKAFSLKKEARVNGVTAEQWRRHETYMRSRKFPDEIAAYGLDYVDSVDDLKKLMGSEWSGWGY